MTGMVPHLPILIHSASQGQEKKKKQCEVVFYDDVSTKMPDLNIIDRE